uniref:Uncharacterized protein n=1 Tax=Kalanchoe fedtschenkoi TaxID=63787 RepID=A0A7N0TCG4_KALFE
MRGGEIVDAVAPETTTSGEAETRQKKVTTKVPQVEIHLYWQGKGPIVVFKADLAGWDQDQLEVRELLDKYGFQALFAFRPENGRGVPIRFNRKNGRSMLTYKDGAIVYIDGEPKVVYGELGLFYFVEMDYSEIKTKVADEAKEEMIDAWNVGGLKLHASCLMKCHTKMCRQCEQ